MPVLVEKHTLPRKKPHANPLNLLLDPATGNKGPNSNLLQHLPGIVAQCHQVEFTKAPGKAPHQEMVDARPETLEGP